MVLDFYGIGVSTLEMATAVTTENGLPPETELARFAGGRGLQAACHSYNLYLLHPDDASRSADRLLAKLSSQRNHPWFDNDFCQISSSMVKCLEAGVQIKVDPPNFDTIATYLGHGVPVIVSVNPLVLNQRQGGDIYAGHTVVLAGLEADQICYLDPADGMEHTIGREALMLAIVARKFIAIAAWLVAIWRPDRPDTAGVFRRSDLIDLF